MYTHTRLERKKHNEMKNLYLLYLLFLKFQNQNNTVYCLNNYEQHKNAQNPIRNV